MNLFLYHVKQYQQDSTFVAAQAAYGGYSTDYAPAQSYGAPNQQAYAQPNQAYETYGSYGAQNQPAHAPTQNYGVPHPQQNIAAQQTYAGSPQQPFQGNTLRKEAPITQKPSPVYQSQPVASTFQGKKEKFFRKENRLAS